jgi:hypothetical protein
MYFIASGNCLVEQKDIISAKIINNKLASLIQGDYFGVRSTIFFTIIAGSGIALQQQANCYSLL